MIIYALSGIKIFETSHKTLRGTLEAAAEAGASLASADFRNVRLQDAALDGLVAPRSCFWGADLTGADVGLADLRGADLRRANLSDVCFAETDLSDADARGACFSRTIFEQSILDRMKISCPSFWDCDLRPAASMQGLVYSHLGETDIIVDTPPLVIRGLERRLVLAGHHCLWGNVLVGDSRNPTNPIPKIPAFTRAT